MKRYAVTCVFELVYNDSIEEDDILFDVQKHYTNCRHLSPEYEETFTIVQVEQINE